MNLTKYRLLIILVVCFHFLTLSSCGDNISFNAPDGLIVILKADDLGEMTPNWSRFISIVEKDSICAGIGVISNNVKTNAAIADIRQISTIKQNNGFPVIEFWDHGFDHSKEKGMTEFNGTPYDYQQSHLQQAQNFFTNTLQLTSHAFGAPFNRTSNITASALKNFPELNIWQCDQKIEQQNSSTWRDPDKVVIHPEDQNILLNIQYVYFHVFPIKEVISNYNHDNDKPYIVIQIHPAVWHNNNFADFERLIRFYKKNHRATFMTPYQYYQYLHKVKTAS